MGGREQLIFVFLVVGHKNLVGGFFQVRGSKFLAAGGGFPPPPPPPPPSTSRENSQNRGLRIWNF